MKRLEGYRNITELSEYEKQKIITYYYAHPECSIKQMSIFFKLTQRTIPAILKAAGIDSNRLNRYTLNEDYFEQIDTERKAYWLGYIYADGFVGSSRYNNFVFSQKESDGYVIYQFAQDINFTGKIRRVEIGGGFPNAEKAVIINFSCKKFVEDLNALGVFTKKSMTISELPDLQDDLMRHFIRGYFDGDGSISRNIKGYTKSGIPNFSRRWSVIGPLTFLYKIAQNVPIEPKFWQSHTPSMYYLGNRYENDLIALFYYLYKDASFFVYRKYKIWKLILGDFRGKLLDAKRDKLLMRCLKL